ncbi:TPA: hypothetical protein DD617_01205 [Candidatus Uhrbacteria bacterium]|nr:hypothetical protein [Candidatus Uhrbacteria bacterium]
MGIVAALLLFLAAYVALWIKVINEVSTRPPKIDTHYCVYEGGGREGAVHCAGGHKFVWSSSAQTGYGTFVPEQAGTNE